MVLTSTSSSLMPPNSQYIKVDSEIINLPSNKVISMDTGESMVSATADVAATAIDANSPNAHPTNEETPEGDGDAGFEDFLKVITPKDELAKNATTNKPRNPTEETLATTESEGPAAGGDTDNPPPTRRKSSEHKNDLARISVKTVDSWGGKEGVLPPLVNATNSSFMPAVNTTSDLLLDDNEEEDEVSDLDDSDKSDPPDTADNNKSGTGPKRNEQGTGSKKNDDEVANYVNFNKLLNPGTSKYYYSQANHSNRQLLEKVKSRKLQRHASLDESGHSRVSMLSERSRHSSYRGPTPLMKNGSKVSGVIKKSSLEVHSSDGLLSVDSMPVETEGQPQAPKGMKRCSFSSVDIREHERVAGDNPCVTSGVPLSIGWGYYQHAPISLDDYEDNKGPSRDKIEMMVPAGVRRQMLRDEFGVSVAEMNAAMREVNVTKRQRRHTVATEHLEGWSEVLQSAKRKFTRFVKGTSNAKEEEKMWSYAHKGAMNEYLKQHGEGSLGKNPESAGVGSINQGPKIVPQESNGQGSAATGAKTGEAPLLEIITCPQGEGEGAPTF